MAHRYSSLVQPFNIKAVVIWDSHDVTVGFLLLLLHVLYFVPQLLPYLYAVFVFKVSVYDPTRYLVDCQAQIGGVFDDALLFCYFQGQHRGEPTHAHLVHQTVYFALDYTFSLHHPVSFLETQLRSTCRVSLVQVGLSRSQVSALGRCQ